METKLIHKIEKDRLLIGLPVEMTENDATALHEIIKNYIEDGGLTVYVDAKHMEFINSFAIGWLVKSYLDVNALHGDFKLLNLKGHPLKVFEESNLFSVFNKHR